MGYKRRFSTFGSDDDGPAPKFSCQFSLSQFSGTSDDQMDTDPSSGANIGSSIQSGTTAAEYGQTESNHQIPDSWKWADLEELFFKMILNGIPNAMNRLHVDQETIETLMPIIKSAAGVVIRRESVDTEDEIQNKAAVNTLCEEWDKAMRNIFELAETPGHARPRSEMVAISTELAKFSKDWSEKFYAMGGK